VADLELITGLDEPSLSATLEQLLTMGLIETGPVSRAGRGIARPAILPDRLPTAPPGGDAVPWRKTPAVPPPREETLRAAQRETQEAPAKPEPGAPRSGAEPQQRPVERGTEPERAEPGSGAPSTAAQPEASAPAPELAPETAGPFTPETIKRIDAFLIRANSADFYRLLGVGRKAERPAIRSAYFVLAKEFHPDAYFGKDLGDVKAKLERIFRQITRAYEVLSRSKTRKEYDAYLKGQAVLDGQEEEEEQARRSEISGRISEAPPPPPAPTAMARPPVAAPDIRPAAPSGASGTSEGEAPSRSSVSPPPLSSPADRGIEASAQPGAPPPRAGPSAAAGWRRDRTAKQLAAILSGGRRRVVQDRRGADYLTEAEAAAKEEEWGRVVGLLDAAERLGLTEAESARMASLRTAANEQLARISASQARFAESTGDLESALRHAEQACKFGPQNGEHWDLRARFLLRMGRDLHQARDAAMRAIQLAPGVVAHRTTMIRVYLVAGLPKNARREAEAALELEPRDRQLKALLEEAKAAME
jgi:curved DNA-binding protein CbpA